LVEYNRCRCREIIFTFLDKESIDTLIEGHKEAPHLRALQRKLAEELTTFVHSANELENQLKLLISYLEMQLRMI
jgi:tyrosyl-tRNA synthetase